MVPKELQSSCEYKSLHKDFLVKIDEKKLNAEKLDEYKSKYFSPHDTAGAKTIIDYAEKYSD